MNAANSLHAAPAAAAVPPCPEGYVALEWLEHAPGFVADEEGDEAGRV